MPVRLSKNVERKWNYFERKARVFLNVKPSQPSLTSVCVPDFYVLHSMGLKMEKLDLEKRSCRGEHTSLINPWPFGRIFTCPTKHLTTTKLPNMSFESFGHKVMIEFLGQNT